VEAKLGKGPYQYDNDQELTWVCSTQLLYLYKENPTPESSTMVVVAAVASANTEDMW
jgi:hypothetical protein